MINYYIEKEGKIVLFDTDKQKVENTLSFTPQYKDLVIRETERPIVNFEFADTEEYIQEQAQKERERINKLTVTKRVFALALERFGVTYTRLKEVIAGNERATLEWDLCVELERGNPLLDQLAPTFNITSEQLDYIFKAANGEIVIDETIPPTNNEEDVV